MRSPERAPVRRIRWLLAEVMELVERQRLKSIRTKVAYASWLIRAAAAIFHRLDSEPIFGICTDGFFPGE